MRRNVPWTHFFCSLHRGIGPSRLLFQTSVWNDRTACIEAPNVKNACQRRWKSSVGGFTWFCYCMELSGEWGVRVGTKSQCSFGFRIRLVQLHLIALEGAGSDRQAISPSVLVCTSWTCWTIGSCRLRLQNWKDRWCFPPEYSDCFGRYAIACADTNCMKCKVQNCWFPISALSLIALHF